VCAFISMFAGFHILNQMSKEAMPHLPFLSQLLPPQSEAQEEAGSDPFGSPQGTIVKGNTG